MRAALLAVLLASLPATAQEVAKAANGENEMDKGRVIYNQDYSEFFVGTFGPIVPETIDAYVDSLAELGITDLFINVNCQRTNYRSDVWEADWDGYDPSLGDDQPFFKGIAPDRLAIESKWFKNVYAFYEKGGDYPSRMAARCRKDGIRPWISVRMNDCHFPDQPNHPYHSTFWKAHPEWRIARGLDYARPEVREHYLKLIKEVCERFDLDGLELDFMRFGYCFRPGEEHKGLAILTGFIRQVREVTQEAARQWGHPVELAVRIPTRPWIARQLGYDAITWAREGLVDLIVAAPWWESTQSDVPVETWKGMLEGTGVAVAVSLEDGIQSGATKRQTMTPDEMAGVMLSTLKRGADAVYLFNLFTGPYQRWDRAVYNQLLTDFGSYKALRARPRRHPVTIVDPWADGEPGNPRPLPVQGERSVFRIHIGPEPLPDQSAYVELATADNRKPVEVLLNDAPCTWEREDDNRHVYKAPSGAAQEGYNLVTVAGDKTVTLTWVEIAVR